MKKRMLFICVVFLIISNGCDKKQHKDLYENGQTKCSYEINDKGQKHGIYQEFYTSGKIKIETLYENGIKNGRYVEYYENGKIKKYSLYQKDSLLNCDINFWPEGNVREVNNLKKNQIKTTTNYSQDGKIEKLIVWADKFYQSDDGNKYRNIYIRFDKDEYVNIFNSLIPIVTPYKDTISITEKYYLVVGIAASFITEDFYVLTGDFNDNFEITDSTTLRKIYPSKGDRTLTLEIIPDKKGVNTFKCMICNFKSTEEEIKVRNIPVTKTYYVNP